MKKFLFATAATALLAGAAGAEEVKIGVVAAFTGPLETLAPPIAAGHELALKEASESGIFLGGSSIAPVRGDSTCIDAAAATAAVERLITSDRVSGILGPMCSGATGSVVQNVAVPNGMVVISASATSPSLSDIEDNGLFFRTAPSDARQGAVMADIVLEKGISEIAVTYTNNDYGKGLASAFEAAFTAKGGTVTLNAAHEDGKADYSAEVGALASAGGDALAVVGYVDQGGSGIVQAALDTGAFDTFVFPDGMVGDALVERFGSDIDGSFGQNPAAAGEGRDIYNGMAEAAGYDGTSAFSGEAYDAGALMVLAMQAAGSSDPKAYVQKLEMVANAPGEPILPGEIGKALQILADGGDVDYVGVSSIELIGSGESAGSYREVTFEGGEMKVVGYR
ncbi:amino acid/amide ABC transporter substrate-binding protein (HAAT family) [Rhodovulum imhoffii]|uniref:Amino acid/amide ABC transporter substrate-binding protein (HAAT family) n=1 Tax=Rhodovulum imhoffii TaxID=365340 RepID=A0A2T5BTN6_9RHOB|nr:ABC transporter substrate-binding protein [Rhodovulum imhoffii]MBK5934134.1 branched-chain amino acid ABC transporter substrate-binding protein [Rhodovulum imhoffii]PTN02792.1 amino acid/amide ABC transporter substrate-binding protein (HAAT family) [Rhodovulum imhoffii]